MSHYDTGVLTTLLGLFLVPLSLTLRFAFFLSPCSLNLARSLTLCKAQGKWYEIVCRSSETWKGILKAAANDVPFLASLWQPAAGYIGPGGSCDVIRALKCLLT